MTPSNSPDARVARSAVADCTNDRHAASECLDVAPRTETIAGSDCTVQSGPAPLLDSYHNACPYPITNAMPSSTIGRPTLLLAIPTSPLRAIAHPPQARHIQLALMTDKTNARGNRHEAARARLLSGTSRAEPAPATSMKRARRDSPPSSPQQNTVAFPSAERATDMLKPVGKRLRMTTAQHTLPSIGEESEMIEETLAEAQCSSPRARLNSYSFTTTTRTSSRRKSRRHRLYAAQFPARSFVPRLESITETTEPEALAYLACEIACYASATKSCYDETNPCKSDAKIDPSPREGGAGRRRSLTLIEPLRGAWRRLRRADEGQ
ncbi:hypothetical protein AURDEDRAFT_116223 [Auricularia subglabra TFB-10046 SS5]|nr:hypothetical protein AURDEDRAFT_116223 [Auricularia subglabra TFB-10046 SS5]